MIFDSKRVSEVKVNAFFSLSLSLRLMSISLCIALRRLSLVCVCVLCTVAKRAEEY